jgi:hypothetical protein
VTEKQYILTGSELDALRKDASVSGAIRELADILSGRSQDIPHRFRAPAGLAQYLEDYGVNQSYYHQLQIGYNANPLMLQVTTRPTQHIIEFCFCAPDGMRLFTLEIEYAVSEKG